MDNILLLQYCSTYS